MSFHFRVKKRRGQLGISIRRLCKDLGIPKSTYEGWEIDSFPRQPIQYKRLAEYLKVTPEYLMFGTDRGVILEELLVHLERFISAKIEERLAGS